MCTRSCAIIFAPMRISSTASAIFRYLNFAIAPASTKYSERSPMIAKMFDVTMMNVSCATDEHGRDRVEREHDVGQLDHDEAHRDRGQRAPAVDRGP